MLRTFLSAENAEKLKRDLRNRNKPTVFCFFGGENTGKSILAQHFNRLIPNIHIINNFDVVTEKYTNTLVNKGISYIIVECTHTPTSVKEWAENNGYNFHMYTFEKQL